MKRLDGQVALVTGAPCGIGAAVCRGFAREGAAVAVNYRPSDKNHEAARALVTEIRALGVDSLAAPGDVADPATVSALVRQVEAELGRIEVLVTNAAATIRKPWNTIRDSEWAHVLGVTLDGAFYCSRAVFGGMRALGRGKIITISSIEAELGAAGCLPYVTAKAGIIGFTRALAREIGPAGVRVNCVMPGAIRTERELEDFPDQDSLAARLAEAQSLSRRGIPGDVAGAAIFLASSESDFITGQVLTVDGGWVNY